MTHGGQTFVSLDALDGRERDALPAKARSSDDEIFPHELAEFFRDWLQLPQGSRDAVALILANPGQRLGALFASTGEKVSFQAWWSRIKIAKMRLPYLEAILSRNRVRRAK